jgi:hypothetical protein
MGAIGPQRWGQKKLKLAAEQDALDRRNLQDDPDVADNALDIQLALELDNQGPRTV